MRQQCGETMCFAETNVKEATWCRTSGLWRAVAGLSRGRQPDK